MLSFTAAPGALACRRCGAAPARSLRCAPAAALRARSQAGAAAAPAVPHVPVLLPQILGFFEGRAVKVRLPSPDTCSLRRCGCYARRLSNLSLTVLHARSRSAMLMPRSEPAVTQALC